MPRFGEASLKPAVVRVQYDLANDWSGDLSIFFRVLLSDEASKQRQIRATAQQVGDAILKEVKPSESGLQAYFTLALATAPVFTMRGASPDSFMPKGSIRSLTPTTASF